VSLIPLGHLFRAERYRQDRPKRSRRLSRTTSFLTHLTLRRSNFSSAPIASCCVLVFLLHFPGSKLGILASVLEENVFYMVRS
jgi:hypothetical protein